MSATATRQHGSLFEGDLLLETTSCICGIVFAAPARMLAQKREDGKAFYCPHGHSIVFTDGKTRAEKLEEDLRKERGWRAGTQARLDRERAHSSAMRGVATRRKNELDRVKRRVAGGVCPCCDRTFQQLARHMSAKHPEYVETPTPNASPDLSPATKGSE